MLVSLLVHVEGARALQAGQPIQQVSSVLSGVLGFLWDAGLLTGTALVLIRRGTLPLGALTTLIALNAIGMGFLLYNEPFPMVAVVARIAAAIIVELLYIRLQPSAQRPLALRWFSSALTAMMAAMHFAALQLTQGVWWTIHLWAGIIVLSSIVGVLCSYMTVSPTLFSSSTD